MKMIFAAAALVANLCLGSVAHAQQFPSKTFTIIVTNAAGGPNDAIARVWAEQLRRKSGQNVVVENRPGGAGVVAMSAMVAAPADGHTVAMGGNQIQALLVKGDNYDPSRATPVSLLAQSSFTLVTTKASNLKTYRDLIAFAKANPGKLTVGFVTGVHELYTHAFEQEVGIKATLVPYKGSAPLDTAMLTGEINATLLSSFARVQSGQVVGLASGTAARRTEMPDVPTFKELGIGYEPHGMNGIWARSDTPSALLDRLNRECLDLVRSPEFTDTVVQKLSWEPMGTTREQSIKLTQAELDRLKAVAERAGIKPQ
jgi:tripartite-type tricarboxylate transporter receptor subunit TctC